MIVCHCHSVNDRTIRTAVREGACSVSEVSQRCGAASGCGGCAPTVEELIDEEHAACRAVRRLPVLDYVADVA